MQLHLHLTYGEVSKGFKSFGANAVVSRLIPRPGGLPVPSLTCCLCVCVASVLVVWPIENLYSSLVSVSANNCSVEALR